MKSLYFATIIFSAFLAFIIQPSIAKMLLPWFGGSAAVWLACNFFFQLGVLIGYAYVCWFTRFFSIRHQIALHVCCLVIGLLLLLWPGAWMWDIPDYDVHPIRHILFSLTYNLGLPYVLLSTTSPLLQFWYAHSAKAKLPYRLYVIANIGALLALFSYPLLIEPLLSIRQQQTLWLAMYGTFTVLCISTAIVSYFRINAAQIHIIDVIGPPFVADADIETQNLEDIPEGVANKPGFILHILWVLLSAVPSALLLTNTNYISQSLSVVPFLWVLLLSVYLLSFILCFAGLYRPSIFNVPFFCALLVMAGVALLGVENFDVRVSLVILVGGLFVVSMVCHGELFLLKPHPRYLTHFYLMLAIGGAGGSASVLLFAPMFCSFYQELPIILIGSTLLFLLLRIRNKMGQKPRLWLMPNFISNCIGTAIVCFCSIFVMWHQAMDQRPVFRNAYGVLRLTDQRTSDPRSEQRILYHGGIRHGMQWLHPERRHELSTYYCEHSGVGLALRSLASDTAHKIGLLGLGVGTMAAYGRKGDVYRFYEINQQVIKLARNKFFYLQQSLATIQIVVGDARISLDREKSQQFDFLAVDCFTGDAIPVHLLTREAFKIYFSHLKADGILALHISNRFIDLAPVVARLAHSFGKKAKQISSPESADKTCSEATWILISSHASFSQHNLLKDQAKTIQISPHTPFWTDNYSSLFSIMFQN